MSRKIVFSHRRAVGDCLMFTCGVRDFKLLLPQIKINVNSNFPEIWENNPYIDKDLKKKDPGVEFYKVGYPIINNANNANTHFTQGFLFDMLANADLKERLPISIAELVAAFANGVVGDPDIDNPLMKKYKNICEKFARQRADIYLSEEDKKTNIIKENYGYDRFWVVAPGGKRDCTTKIWDWRKFQDVVDHFKGRIKFAVIGRSDHLVEPIQRTIDLVDKFNDSLRGLFSLVYHSQGVVSGVSFLMHLAGAMPSTQGRKRKPCVAIYGGREPTTFTCYTNHQVLHTNGAFTCCDQGGCWQSRIVPIPKDRDKNTRMCHHTIKDDGRTIQECMASITTEDVIRGIEKYYEGNIYRYTKPKRTYKPIELVPRQAIEVNERKEINFLASLQSRGGGEQSACHIVNLLREAGWRVNFFPWETVHSDFRKIELEPATFRNGMAKSMRANVPLFFYANDQIWDFVNKGKEVIESSSQLGIGINFANGNLTKAGWLSSSGKLKAVVFQNEEKKDEFIRDAIGFEETKKIVLFGAIKLDGFLEACTTPKKQGKELVVIKHGLPDWRKYVTKQSEGTGEKIHIWQKHFIKENDIKFYTRLLKDVKNIRFEFMEAHKEIKRHFMEEKRMKFHRWNAMPVEKFLARGHVYLHRMSNKWRDQYPRVVAEALAAGLPVLSEPRDGTKDRVIHGNTGFYCTHYDEFCLSLKTLNRKEGLREAMGRNAKDWARQNLDPKLWIQMLDEIFYQ